MSMAQIPGIEIVEFVGLLSIVIYISGVFIFLARFLYLAGGNNRRDLGGWCVILIWPILATLAFWTVVEELL